MSNPLVMENEHSNTLSDDYYRVNFHALVSFVTETYSDILHSDEIQWYAKVCSLSVSAQRLYIRLLMRRGSTFRQSRLNYPEISDLPGAFAQLDRQALATIKPPQDLAILTACFTKPELLGLLNLDARRNPGRADLLAQIQRGRSQQTGQFMETLQNADHWITIQGHHYFTLMQLCFFGNLYQDISEFVLRDLGTVRYANYTISRLDRPFQSREQIEAHLVCHECMALMESVDQRDPVALIQLASKLPQFSGDAHLTRRVDRFRNTVARQLERLSEHEKAMALYEQCVYPPARERRVRWLLSQSHLDKVFELCSQMLDHPVNEAERCTANRLMRQWRKASNLTVGSVAGFRPQTSQLILEASTERVERAACSFYQRHGQCHYVENALFNGVLGLAIWDIMFHSIPGAFFNPFQMAPADFKQPSFIRNRQHLLLKRMQEIRNQESFQTRVLETFSANLGTANPLVHWGQLDADLIQLAIRRIPSAHWLAVFNRLLLDLDENTTGLPDLIFFPESGGYELIEIKGPSDSLQSNQRRWLQYFDEHRMPCRVVQLRWSSRRSASAESP